MRADIVKSEIAALFAACPELADDDQLRADMVEGETSLQDAMVYLNRARQIRIAESNGIADHVDALNERKARKLCDADRIKGTMLELLRIANLDKLVLPEATLSVTKPRASVEVTDPDALPQGYFLIERKPMKAAIKAAIEAGEAIPGASIVYSGPSLSVRVK